MSYTLADLTLRLRKDRLDDNNLPYRWEDSTLWSAINQAQNEVTRRAPVIIDGTTNEICRIALRPGVGKYAMDPRVVQVRESYLGPLARDKTFSWSGGVLVDSANGFLNAGFIAGTRIIVNGFAVAGNNGLFTLTQVAAGALTVSEQAGADEAPLSVVEIKADQIELAKATRLQMDTRNYYRHWQTWMGPPAAYIEEENGEITAVPIPDACNTLNLIVQRLPMADMTVDTGTGKDLVPGVGTEIPDKYVLDMLDWACKVAYEKGDEETFSVAMAAYWDKQFTDKFGPKPSARMEEFRRKFPRGPRMNPQEFGFSDY